MRKAYYGRPATEEEILAAFELELPARVAGLDEWRVKQDCWTDRYAIETRLFNQNNRTRIAVELTALRKLVKRDLLVEGEKQVYGRKTPRFTTPKMWEAIERERNLTEGERVERTVAAITQKFDENVHEYGDNIWRQPVDVSYFHGPKDGLAPAVELGLIVKVEGPRGLSGGARYVPADRHEAWKEAYDAEIAREEARRSHLDDLHRRMLDHFPTDGRHDRVIELREDQVLAILALVRESPDATHAVSRRSRAR